MDTIMLNPAVAAAKNRLAAAQEAGKGVKAARARLKETQANNEAYNAAKRDRRAAAKEAAAKEARRAARAAKKAGAAAPARRKTKAAPPKKAKTSGRNRALSLE